MGVEAEVNDSFHMYQKYEISVYLNHELSQLKSATFKVCERLTQGVPEANSMAKSSGSQEAWPIKKCHAIKAFGHNIFASVS